MATMIRNTIEREVVYPQPIERVWAALTEADQLKNWFGSKTAEIDLRPGGAMHLVWEDMTARAIIETVNPTSYFSWRWKPGSVFDDTTRPLAEQEPLTRVEFTLEPVERGTRLRMVESGFADFDESQRSAALGQNTEGWNACFMGLAALLGSADGR